MKEKIFHTLACIIVIIFCSVSKYNINEKFTVNKCYNIDSTIYLCSTYSGDRSFLGKYELSCQDDIEHYFWQKETEDNKFIIGYGPDDKNEGSNIWKIVRYPKCKSKEEMKDESSSENCNDPELLFTNKNIDYSTPIGKWVRETNSMKYPEPISRRVNHPSCSVDYTEYVKYLCPEPRSCPFSDCANCLKKCKVDPNSSVEDLKENKDCIENCLKLNAACGSGEISHKEEMQAALDLYRRYPINQNLLDNNNYLEKFINYFKYGLMSKLKILLLILVIIAVIIIIIIIINGIKQLNN